MCSIFSKETDNNTSPRYRKATGIACASAGIILNLMLFFVKLAAGNICGSVAVKVDAFHNLTDMGSSAVTLISFLLPEKNREIKENIAGFIIGIVLIIAGIELAQTSVGKIISPEPTEFSLISVVMLTVSVAVKFFMAWFNKKCSVMINSAALKAASVDCLCDSVATTVAAFAVIISEFSSFNADAYGGLAVSLFILSAGCKTVCEHVSGLIVFIKRK